MEGQSRRGENGRSAGAGRIRIARQASHLSWLRTECNLIFPFGRVMIWTVKEKCGHKFVWTDFFANFVNKNIRDQELYKIQIQFIPILRAVLTHRSNLVRLCWVNKPKTA